MIFRLLGSMIKKNGLSIWTTIFNTFWIFALYSLNENKIMENIIKMIYCHILQDTTVCRITTSQSEDYPQLSLPRCRCFMSIQEGTLSYIFFFLLLLQDIAVNTHAFTPTGKYLSSPPPIPSDWISAHKYIYIQSLITYTPTLSLYVSKNLYFYKNYICCYFKQWNISFFVHHLHVKVLVTTCYSKARSTDCNNTKCFTE